ncbi:MAG: DUF2703 domain-containing protein [Actinomycetota bacterium]
MTGTKTKPLIEILTFDGCPNREPAIELVSRVARERGVDADVQVIDVPDAEAARRTRFLGSPTIRVDGHDIEPGADVRTDYVLSCRIFRTGSGMSGQPEERWLLDALARAGGEVTP